jgi:threonine dehydrogenase-like Zn-dependent dehydrogenase
MTSGRYRPAKILRERDEIIPIIATAICELDLQLYRGKISELKDGDVLGHEFVGVVVDTGSDMSALRKCDRVVVPFVIACEIHYRQYGRRGVDAAIR